MIHALRKDIGAFGELASREEEVRALSPDSLSAALELVHGLLDGCAMLEKTAAACRVNGSSDLAGQRGEVTPASNR